MADRFIKQLSEEVASKIAAGEVVERPLSVVKELVENSIDAGASALSIEIKAGGKDYIRVSDNGCGIDRAQLTTAFERYATSKITSAEDLNSIETLGFRGEALASIVAVSKVSLTTKTESENVGACINIQGKHVKSIQEAACETGTTIIVRNLFFNTPARQKFLKADNVEAALIIDFVSKVAIAYPSIAVQLTSAGNILFATNGKGDLLNAIAIVYGPDVARNLVAVEFDDGAKKISGFVSSPTYSKNNKHWETFFVNGRLIKSKLLEDSVGAAYRDKLFKDQYPIVFLFLTLPPTSIDVNVHPHKTEIKFYDEDDLQEFIVQSVRMGLLNPNSLNVTKFTKADEQITKLQAKLEGDSLKSEKEKIEEANKLTPTPSTQLDEKVIEEKILEGKTVDEIAKEVVKSMLDGKDAELTNANIFKSEEKPALTIEVQEEVKGYDSKKNDNKFRFRSLTYIGQAFNTYLICKDAENIYFIDQHAAHERVMYERLLAAFNREETLKQPIITPIVIDLTVSLKVAAIESLDILNKMGFTVEEFGPTSFVAKEIPASMSMREAELFLDQFFDAADEHLGNIQAKRDVIISRSCKAAVKAHDRLADMEVVKLFTDLDECENPFSCPHGRPTFLKFTNVEIERMFKRR